MISASTITRMIRPSTPVIEYSVLIFSWFGEAPSSGVKVFARAGTAAMSSVNAATPVTAKLFKVLMERKAGATIRVRRLRPREGRLALLDECEHAFLHVISAKKL